MIRPGRQVIASTSGWMVVGLALVTLLPGSGPAQETTGPERWTGCWEVEWGEWSPPLPERDTLRYRPSPRVELTDARSAAPREGAFHAQPAPGSLPTPHSDTGWRPISDDSISIGWSGGTTGTAGYFAGRGDTLRGQLRTFTDAPPHPRHRSEASLTRVPCSAPSEVPASAAGPGLWFVPLEGGATIHLGRLLPRELIERPGEVAYRIAGTPMGIFSGARDVRAQLSRGGAVADVRLTYPRDAPLDSLVAAFRDTLGAPMHRDRREGRTRVLWLTDANSVTLRRSGEETWLFLSYPGADWGVAPEHVQTPRGDSTGGLPGQDDRCTSPPRPLRLVSVASRPGRTHLISTPSSP